MWHKVINENKFISLLYDEVPELINVNIINVKLEDQGRKVSLLFVMPEYADHPPKKWHRLKYNSIVVELNFFDVNDLSFTSTNKDLSGDISIESNDHNTLNTHLSVTLTLNLKASGRLIQKMEGYIDEIDTSLA